MVRKNFCKKNVLAIDTSLDKLSIAILEGRRIIAERSILKQKGQSEDLFYFIEQLLNEISITYKNLEAIGVGVGPGNFTGLRMGISAAKGLAIALKIKVFGINRFETLVDKKQPTLSLIQIKNGTFYSQLFINKQPIELPTEETLFEILNKKYLPNTIISGDCALSISKDLKLQAGKNNSIPDPKDIGLMVLKYIKIGGPSPSPLYIKGPDAKLPKDPIPTILESYG